MTNGCACSARKGAVSNQGRRSTVVGGRPIREQRARLCTLPQHMRGRPLAIGIGVDLGPGAMSPLAGCVDTERCSSSPEPIRREK